MSEMVERVTAAIYAALGEGNMGSWMSKPGEGLYSIEFTTLDGDFNLKAVARAAIAAMREPTKAMTKEGEIAVSDGCDGSRYIAGDVWDRMLVAALDD